MSNSKARIISDVLDENGLIKADALSITDESGVLGIPSVDGLQPALDDKVDKVTGKGLSTEDYTTTEKNKLDGIEAGAEVNVDTNLGTSANTTQRTVTSSTGADVSLPAANTTQAGVMSSADRTKLDGIEAGAQVNVGTNLGITGTGNTRTITSSTGSDVTVPVATSSNAGLMATGDKSKLDGIEAGAEVNTVTSVAAKTGAVTLNKSDVGLGNVDNTSDLSKPISTSTQSALDAKVAITDIVNNLTSNNADKPLSANQGLILKGFIDNINAVLQSDDTTLDELQEIVDFIKQNRQTLDALGISNIAGLQAALDTKVDKITGKGLSTEDYTTAEKNKLAGIAAGAEVNVATNLGTSANTTQRTVTSSTGTNVVLPVANTTQAGVMSSADRTKLDGIAAGAQVNVGTNLGSSGTGGTRTITSSTGSDTSITYTKSDIGLGNVDNTSDANKPISTATQSALDGKENTFTKNTAFNKNFGTAADTVTQGNDSRLSNSREWTASTISQAEAEAGTATTRRAFTAQRVFQAIVAWWNGSSDKSKLDGIEAGAQVNVGTNLGITGTGNTRTITSSTGSDVTVPVASTSTAGLMATGDKTKLDGIAAGAQVNVATNLTYSTAATTGTVNSSTGTNATIPAATTSLAGLLTNTDKSKLDGIAAGAQVNVATNLGTSANTTQRTVTSSTGSNVILPVANTTQAGVMSSADRTKLDGIAAGAQVNVATNLGYTASTRVLTSSTGSNVTLPQVTTSADGLMIAADKTKLNGIAAGAQVNVATNLSSSGTGATRTIASSTGTNASITYSAADVGAAPTGRTLTAGDGLTGGGNLTANRTFAVDSTVVRTSGNQTIGGVKTFSNRINLDTSDGEIFITPTGWRSSERAAIKIRSKSDNPAELDLRQTSGSFEPGWHISARGSGQNRELQIYRFNMNASGVADSSSFSLVYGFGANGTLTAPTFSGSLSGNATTATTATNCSRSIVAGNGLTGGGALTANRTLTVGAGSGISVAASSVAVDGTVIRTSGNQSMSGIKTFSNKVSLSVASGSASINFPRNGTANPTGTVDGDIWYRSNNLYYNNLGTIRAIAHTGSWSAMSVAEGQAGTATSSRFMRADRLGPIISAYAPTLTGGGASGSWAINVTGSSGSTTGNAATATALQTARTIGGVSFNGTANINLPGVNIAGNQNTSGNAATATTATNCSRSVVAGNGLTGGGALTANRTLTVGAGSGISVAASSVAVDSTVIRTSGNQSMSGTKTFSTSPRITAGLGNWNVTSPGTGIGSLHIGAASTTADVGPAITFGARDASSGSIAQAGIYIRSGGTFGTRMYIATTDSYATGSRTAITISEGGVVSINRNVLTLATQATGTTHAVRADRTISTGSGLSGGGNLTTDRTLSVDATVVRTSGNQTIGGVKTFTSETIVNGGVGVASAGTFHVRQRGDTVGDGIALTSSNGTAHRIWKDTAGNFNIGTAGDSQQLSISLTGVISGNGSGLTSLNGSNISSGTVADARIASTLVRTSRSIATGSGLSGGGNLTANRTLSVDASVVRTSGDQLISGEKEFRNNTNGESVLRVTNNNTGTNATAIIRLNNASSGSHGLIFLNGANRSVDGGVNTMSIRNNLGALRLMSTSGSDLSFWTSTSAERMTIKSNGNVGIGTSAPTRSLHVVSTVWDNSAGAGSIFENNNSVGAGITLKPTASVVANGSLGWALYAGGPSAAIGDGNLGFWAHGTNQVRMMITRSGNVGIGTTSPSERLHVVGNILASGNVTAFSDVTLKDNIEVIPNAVEKILQCRGVTYTRKDEDDKTKRHSGVIAQEVEAVLPEVVQTNQDGIKSVAYGNMVGLLIEAIKEQQTQIELLKSEISGLKEKLNGK